MVNEKEKPAGGYTHWGRLHVSAEEESSSRGGDILGLSGQGMGALLLRHAAESEKKGQIGLYLKKGRHDWGAT